MSNKDSFQKLFKKMLDNYTGGLSNTSVKKFDEMKGFFAKLLNIDQDGDIYICGAGTRPGNLEVRLTQGLQATKHTKLGIGIATVNSPKRIDSISDSAVKTIRKFLGKGKASYDAIGVMVQLGNEVIFTRLLESHSVSFSAILKKEFPDLKIERFDLKSTADPKGAARKTDFVESLNKGATRAPESSSELEIAGSHIGMNIVYFGSPGTGKSHRVDELIAGQPFVRVAFHPEYSYGDFVGTYRPVVGHELTSKPTVQGHDGSKINKPVSYFDFVPGPFLVALENAFAAIAKGLSEQLFLVIEEINRGDCAAIFGDVFQLLDRDDSGLSRFGILMRPEIQKYFADREVDFDLHKDGRLYIPPNLTLLATMNTSDQSLYPMDSAFKRRWHWISCPVDYGALIEHTAPFRPTLDDGFSTWDWVSILQALNELIVLDRMEDKQIGPWFIRPNPETGAISRFEFCNKCLFYLWHDVFKDEQLSQYSPFASETGKGTFEHVQSGFAKSGINGVFSSTMIQAVKAKQDQID